MAQKYLKEKHIQESTSILVHTFLPCHSGNLTNMKNISSKLFKRDEPAKFIVQFDKTKG